MRSLLLWALVVAGCSSAAESPTGGQPAAPAALSIILPPSGTAANRIAFPTQPVIQLRDARGDATPAESVLVTATLTSGGGTLDGTTSVRTGPLGTALFADLAIGGTAGDHTITFSAPGLVSVTAQVTTTPGLARYILAATGDGQTAGAGQPVLFRPTVQVLDADSNAVPGAVVTFRVTGGGGTITLPQPRTNGFGLAAVGSWTLGATGVNTLEANTPGAFRPAIFTASATLRQGGAPR